MEKDQAISTKQTPEPKFSICSGVIVTILNNHCKCQYVHELMCMIMYNKIIMASFGTSEKQYPVKFGFM